MDTIRPLASPLVPPQVTPVNVCGATRIFDAVLGHGGPDLISFFEKDRAIISDQMNVDGRPKAN